MYQVPCNFAEFVKQRIWKMDMSSISLASMARNVTKTFQKYCLAGLWLLKKYFKSLARQVKVLPFGIQIHVLDLAATISLSHLTKMWCYFLPSGVCKPPPSYLNKCLKVRTKSTFPWLLSGTESDCQCGRHGFHPWVGKIPWMRKWQPTPAFLPGKSHGQRSLVCDRKRVGHDWSNLHPPSTGYLSNWNKPTRAPFEFMLVSISSSAYPPSSMTVSHSVDCGNITEIKIQLKWLFPVCYLLSLKPLTNFLWTGIMSYKS